MSVTKAVKLVNHGIISCRTAAHKNGYYSETQLLWLVGRTPIQGASTDWAFQSKFEHLRSRQLQLQLTCKATVYAGQIRTRPRLHHLEYS